MVYDQNYFNCSTLGPQVLEKIDPAQTVVNPKLELIYDLFATL
jgi:hypothetical protein